jgi:imidazole glycerol-phosphate synthase subunit HisH
MDNSNYSSSDSVYPMSQKIVIIDYGVGNLHSVYKKLVQLNAEVSICHSPKEVSSADKIILPGIGHFGKGIQNLKALSYIDVLHEEVIIRKKPILGICLGMQLMARCSQEAPEENGLAWFNNEVIRFQFQDTTHFKIPQIGWNHLRIIRENVLLKNISPGSEFYFCHSYHFDNLNSCTFLSETEYSYPFVSAIAQDHIFGVQFHPEKSYDQGITVFQNFLNF